MDKLLRSKEDHIKTCFDNIRANDIDAQAIEKAIGSGGCRKGGHGLSIRTVNKLLTNNEPDFQVPYSQ